MYLVLFLFILLAITVSYSGFFKKRFEEVLPITVLSMTLLMYVCSILGSLKVGYYAVIGLTILAIGFSLYFVWKDKKCSKMLSYGTLWIPIVCQFMLLIQHASEIAAGSHECQLKQVQFQSSCSVLPFIFTPLLDSLNLVFSVVGFCCASIMFWCAPKVHKLLNPPENKKGLKKGLVGKDEEVFDPIGSMQKEATKSIFKSFFSSKK